MRSLTLIVFGLSLAIAPVAWAGHAGHEPTTLTLYGSNTNPQAKDFALTPYKEEKDWVSLRVCDLPDFFVPPPVGDCQSITYALKDKVRNDFEIAKGPVKLRWYLSVDWLAVSTPGDPVPYIEDAGVAPGVIVEATFKIKDKDLGTKVQQKDVVTMPDGKPTAFDFEFSAEDMKVAAGSPITLDIEWYMAETPAGRTSLPFWNVHDGGEYAPTITLSSYAKLLDFALEQERIALDRICAQDESYQPGVVEPKLFKKACKDFAEGTFSDVIAIQAVVNSTFENPPVDAKNFTVKLVGPAVPSTLSKPHDVTENGTTYIGIAWNYKADAADPAEYKVDASYGNQAIGALDLASSVLPEGQSLPAPTGLLVVAAVVGLLALVGLRRR